MAPNMDFFGYFCTIMAPTLTIITPAHNSADHLRMLYESLATQTCPDFEWIIADDGSTDYTRRLADTLAAQRRIPVRLISLDHVGRCASLAAGYAVAEGELAVCVDPDRFVPDDGVEAILTAWRGRTGDHCAGVRGSVALASSMEPGREKISALRTDLLRRAIIPQTFPGEREPDHTLIEMQAMDGRTLVETPVPLCITEDRTDGFEVRPSAWRRFKTSPLTAREETLIKRNLAHTPLLQKLRHTLALSLIELYLKIK